MSDKPITPSWVDASVASLPPPVNITLLDEDSKFFKFLGYDKDRYYYFTHAKSQLIMLYGSEHGKGRLTDIAPLQHWKNRFSKDNGKTVDWDMAADHLKRSCEREGFFTMDKIRGRGAWWDKGNIVFHLGNTIMVGDKQYKISEAPKSEFIYETQKPINIDITKPLTTEESLKFLELMRKMSWVEPVSAVYAAGWCAVANIGGALNWRPHVWIVGAAGSGKSTIMNRIIDPAMGNNKLPVLSDTSAAGIVQKLKSDSIPVLFDEIESDDASQRARIQTVLSLARQSSSNTGAEMLKGTPGGSSNSYVIRSCFIFSSIHANIMHAADKSRITLLEVDKNARFEDFKDIEQEIHDMITPEFAERLTARSIKLAGDIRKNARTFAGVVAEKVMQQRAGDQIGTLLAGAYSLVAEGEVTLERARAWVQKITWTDIIREIESYTDEQRLWKMLLAHKIKYNATDGHVKEERLGHLIDRCFRDKISQDDMKEVDIYKAISQFGIITKFDENGVYRVIVSNNSYDIKAVLRESKWGADWGNVLKRIAGAKAVGPYYFGYQGSRSRGVSIPYNLDENME